MRTALPRAVVPAMFTLAVAAAAAAQTGTSPQPPKPDQSVTTIVGCLVQGNPSVAASANDYFVRTPTVVLPVGGTVAVGKPGTASTATSSGKPTTDSYYRITGLGTEQLRPHLNHRVEVQGHLMAKKPDASAGGMTNTKTTVDAAGKPKVAVETRVDVAGDLHATTLKMVSASCQ